MRIERQNLDGQGAKRTQIYDLPSMDAGNYWANVTDVPCPARRCTGTVRWAEAGYVPGYRICDSCGRHYLARGTAATPELWRVGARRSRRAN